MKRDTLQDWEFRRDEWDARERGMENLYNEIAESVLTAPIEDLEEEIRAEGRDPDKVAEEVRQIMRDALAHEEDIEELLALRRAMPIVKPDDNS